MVSGRSCKDSNLDRCGWHPGGVRPVSGWLWAASGWFRTAFSRTRFLTGSGNMAVSRMRNASGNNYRNSLSIVDEAMGQIPRSTECISSFVITCHNNWYLGIWQRVADESGLVEISPEIQMFFSLSVHFVIVFHLKHTGLIGFGQIICNSLEMSRLVGTHL